MEPSTNPPFPYSRLEWDSAFFGFPVAKASLTLQELDSLPMFLASMKSQGIHLVYGFSPEELPTLEASLQDRKVWYSQDIRSRPPSDYPSRISSIQSPQDSEALQGLALQSGQYSRYAVDAQMPPGKFAELYLTWINKSITRQLADEIFVVRGASGTPVGMVTVSQKDATGHIGLIAVNAENRGQHIGEDLVQAALTWASLQGLQKAEVITQLDNLPACRLYEKCGYSPSKVEYVYHFWL